MDFLRQSSALKRPKNKISRWKIRSRDFSISSRIAKISKFNKYNFYLRIFWNSIALYIPSFSIRNSNRNEDNFMSASTHTHISYP